MNVRSGGYLGYFVTFDGNFPEIRGFSLSEKVTGKLGDRLLSPPIPGRAAQSNKVTEVTGARERSPVTFPERGGIQSLRQSLGRRGMATQTQ